MLKESDLVSVRINNEGNVGAGRVLPFPDPIGTVSVDIPSKYIELAEAGLIGQMTVDGDSLEDVGYFYGDTFLVKKVFNWNEITPDTICIIRMLPTDEILAKRVILNEGPVRLRSYNVKVPDIVISEDSIEIRGIVIQDIEATAPDKAGCTTGYVQGLYGLATWAIAVAGSFASG